MHISKPNLHSIQVPPFSIRLLKSDNYDGTNTSQVSSGQLLSAFPASYRTDTDDIIFPSRDYIACIEKELGLERLDNIFSWLWVVGRPMPPQPLHYQLLLGREIVISEQWTAPRLGKGKNLPQAYSAILTRAKFLDGICFL
jgi:hypothetical protein